MQERARFVLEAEKAQVPMTALCDVFGIAPKTGYKWLARFKRDGFAGLEERSRRPHSNSRAIDEAVAKKLIALRKRRRTWGARKLIAWLSERSGETAWPAPSTVTELLKRQDLVAPRQRRRRAEGTPSVLAEADGPNVVWSGDFKGYFLVGNGERCDPLTVSDVFSRYLLCCNALPSQRGQDVRRTLEATFRQYGMPAVFRSDNGAPFGAPGYGVLSRLAVWLIRLGIRPEYITPGKPQQNGRHERMHLTLKQDTTLPPAATIKGQQRRFERFRRDYNDERPHEALGQKTPASVYVPSVRGFPRKLGDVEYPRHYELRQVKQRGEIKWRGHLVRLTPALSGQTVGLRPLAEDCWQIYFGPVLLGSFHTALSHLGLIRYSQKPLPMSPV